MVSFKEKHFTSLEITISPCLFFIGKIYLKRLGHLGVKGLKRMRNFMGLKRNN